MANHSLHKAQTKKRMSRKQITLLVAAASALAFMVGGGILTSQQYSLKAASTQQVTAYSATGSVSRSTVREEIRNGRGGLDKNTSFVKVVINGQSQLVFGTDFTTVKSVLEAGDITLEPEDNVTPALNDKVSESTVITISRANTTVETVNSSIAFNTIEKKDSNLPVGTTKVETEGEEGVMESTNLVQKSGSRVVSTNTLASYVKKAPVNKVVLVGTKVVSTPSSSSSSSSASAPTNYGTTAPVGEAQAYAHDQVKARGWSESEFTCLVQLWQRESGWRTNAHNPSGAHGIPQALPGSKMGPGWENDYKVQINWGLGYIQGRYSTPCGAWAHSNSTGWY